MVVSVHPGPDDASLRLYPVGQDLCCQPGGRLAKKAAMPSCASAVAQRSASAAAVISANSAGSGPDSDRSSALAAATAPGAQSSRAAVSSSTAASSSSAETARAARPARSGRLRRRRGRRETPAAQNPDPAGRRRMARWWPGSGQAGSRSAQSGRSPRRSPCRRYRPAPARRHRPHPAPVRSPVSAARSSPPSIRASARDCCIWPVAVLSGLVAHPAQIAAGAKHRALGRQVPPPEPHRRRPAIPPLR